MQLTLKSNSKELALAADSTKDQGIEAKQKNLITWGLSPKSCHVTLTGLP
ncbi:hypothetical protein [Nostoc sp.]